VCFFNEVDDCLTREIETEIMRETRVPGDNAAYVVKMAPVSKYVEPPELLNGYAIRVEPELRIETIREFPTGLKSALRRLGFILSCDLGYGYYDTKSGTKDVQRIDLLGINPKIFPPRRAAIMFVLAFVLRNNYDVLENAPMQSVSFARDLAR